MTLFRKKPVVISAVQWTGQNLTDIKTFVGDTLTYTLTEGVWQQGVGLPNVQLQIRTLEGDMHVSIDDWVIKGVNGEFYPCKPDIFEKTYEIVEEET